MLVSGASFVPLAYYIVRYTDPSSHGPWAEVKTVLLAMAFSAEHWGPGYVEVAGAAFSLSIAVLAFYPLGVRVARWVSTGR